MTANGQFTAAEQPPQGSAFALPARGLLALVTIILPMVCVLLGYGTGKEIGPEYQSGRLPDFAKLLFHGKVSLCFYPLMAYSMAGAAALLLAPARGLRWGWVRLGIYGAVPLSLTFVIAEAFIAIRAQDAMTVAIPFGLALAGIGVPLLMRAAFLTCRRRCPGALWLALAAIAVAPAVVAAVTRGFPNAGWMYFAVGVWCSAAGLIFAPLWCLAGYAYLTWRICRRPGVEPFSRAVWIPAAGWLCAYLVSGRFAIMRAIELYHSLPVQPPDDCFVATAAACGHPSLVRAKPVRFPNGATVPVSDQLRTLKFAELVFAALLPPLHTGFRRVYDAVGPRLARRIRRHSLAATAAFVCLKPAEWFARAMLRLMFADARQRIGRFYAGGRDA